MKVLNSELSAVIVAGGVGSRMGADIPKQFIKINGKEIILYTIEKFLKCNIFKKIIIVCHPDYADMLNELTDKYNTDILYITNGGATRMESVYIGISQVSDCKYVLIHDAVRCCVDTEDILKICDEVKKCPCAFGVKVKDTVKQADENNIIKKTVDRSDLWLIQTPQAFETELILKAHKKAAHDKIAVTDDCSVVEYYGEKVRILEGKYENIKITTRSDIELAKIYLNGSE